jgi:hypothetical protein
MRDTLSFFGVACVVSLVLCSTCPRATGAISIGVDAAPNVYGSSQYAPWRTDAFAKISTSAFVNMANGVNSANIGTTNFEPTDAIVYSTGDLGKRLHFVYFIPNATKQSLAGKLEVGLSYDWDGTTYLDYGAQWVSPNFDNLVEISGGVAGTMGNAQWASDDDAPPTSTGGNGYDETDAADVAALASLMIDYQTFWQGRVRVLDENGATVESTVLTATLVPEPTALSLVGLGGFALLRRKRA